MSWKAEYIVLIIISSLVDYFAAIRMSKTNTLRVKKLYLALSIFVNIGMLVAFKYFNFINDSVREFLQLFSIQYSPFMLNVILPVGISFYTFQTISYSIDVYHNKIKPEKHLGIFAVYVAFFPQLVAGPIERANRLIPQLKAEHKFDYTRVTNGLKLMLWGFFKKVVIADRLAIVVNAVYGNPSEYTGITLLVATFFFGYQIYCDFSGYSDIAIGSAQVLGIRLVDNFKRPYAAKNIAEFWRRWHISLSEWFRDYVFTPIYRYLSTKFSRLKTRKKHNVSFFLATMVSLPLLGLWHGANWTFILFGVYYGLMVPLYYFTRKYWDRMPKIMQWGATFGIINIGWVFFRSNSLTDMWYIFTHLFVGLTNPLKGIYLGFHMLSPRDAWTEMYLALGFIIFLELVHLIQSYGGMRSMLSKKPVWIRWTIYAIIVASILLFGVFENTPFIYFQF